MYIVKKPFPYAHDGLTAELLMEGDKRAFRPELVGGLIDDGYIEEPAPAGPPPAAPAPQLRYQPGKRRNR